MQLDSSLTRIAAIHQQHSIKCFFAIEHLKLTFHWPAEDWQQIAALVDNEEPVFDGEVLKPEQTAFDVLVRRRHWILSHGIYPHAYFTMAEWFGRDEPQTIFDYYLRQCLKRQEYLSHNVTILFAFEDAFGLLSTGKQRCRFIERFCEFVTSTFYGNNHLSYLPSEGFVAKSHVKLAQVFKACLRQPGFWGHNLITLSAIVQKETRLTSAGFNTLLVNLYEQCHWVSEDEEDRPVIRPCMTTARLNDGALELACRRLLLEKQANLHQITLASAIVSLYRLNWLSPQDRCELLDVALHFSAGERS